MVMRHTLTALLLHFTIIIISHAIYLDIHVPLPNNDCLMTQTLRANELLRSFRSSSQNSNSERIDLFSKHTPHITLFLADFDLEIHHDDEDNGGVEDDNDSFAKLNVTKVNSFLETISKINFTQVVEGLECTLSLSPTQPFMDHHQHNSNNSEKKFYTINGAFTMLHVQNNPCLKALSNAVLDPIESFVKRPVRVPSWVASLQEPERSAAIYRSRKYGSPNVLEGFVPHLTVGYDPSTERSAAVALAHLDWREDVMEQWNEEFSVSSMSGSSCGSEVKGVAVGRNSIGGTVLADSRMRYWDVVTKNPLQSEAQAVQRV
eukprot:CAMPEP_0201694374 /NCGR_PEP_ID=MMETSP0578-20130828/6673_1 /ASSEMBLY_ACC=CAM_ASM_000663 /TAXON_ID=267565 /ORGANISM="Skeletonema grethea, Strain CCMP 1804" /LENGTH=317 /DNA_ID=CAMNT_0048180057 /DNA_START=60 /DNA_END=1013 /DNA_ORIENTATION=+